MANPIPQTVKELIAWSYANLAMAHYAVEKGIAKYDRVGFGIRKRLYRGLTTDTMKMGSIFDDEKVKLRTGQCCNYCGAEERLSVDHVFARNTGGPDQADNLIYACRGCNSSKGKKDLMEWMQARNEFLPLMVVRRYLKLGPVDNQPPLATLAHFRPLKPIFFLSTPGTSQKICLPEDKNVLRVARKAECPQALVCGG